MRDRKTCEFFFNYVTFLQFVTDLEADKWRSPVRLTVLLYLEAHYSRFARFKGKMSSASLLAIVVISLNVLPLFCHRLITDPYPDRDWDSVIVSSDPITIREKTHNDTTPLKLNKILRPQKRSYEECAENDFTCLYGNYENSKDNNQIVDKFLEHYSHVADVKVSDDGILANGKENENSRKSYWTMIDSQTHNHPYDDKKGWVTLDPVPWSSSKISKWQPNKASINEEGKPWDLGSATQRPVQQFWVSGSSYHSQRPSTQWSIGTNDIITDNKPSDFPSGHYHSNQGLNYQPDNGVYGYPGNYNQFHQNQELKGTFPSKNIQNTHPSTYPSNGNGEWILLSTTKGYSHAQKHRWAGQKDLSINDRSYSSRKIKPIEISKYHEEDLNEKFVLGGETRKGNRKSDSNVSEEAGNNSTSDDSAEKSPIQILYTGLPKDGESATTFRRKVRLQVLPSLDSSSSSHGGLLEVDSNSQTVDEAQQEDEQMKKLKAIANVKKNKIRRFKLIPSSKVTEKGMFHKNVVTMAAVGAGMIPATMALLVPMALGRKKRSLPRGYAGIEGRAPRTE